MQCQWKVEDVSSGLLFMLTKQSEMLLVIGIFRLLHLSSQLSCTYLISPSSLLTPPPPPTLKEDRFSFYSDV